MTNDNAFAHCHIGNDESIHEPLLAPQNVAFSRGAFRDFQSNPLVAFEHLSLYIPRRFSMSVVVCDIRGATCISDAVISSTEAIANFQCY